MILPALTVFPNEDARAPVDLRYPHVEEELPLVGRSVGEAAVKQHLLGGVAD